MAGYGSYCPTLAKKICNYGKKLFKIARANFSNPPHKFELHPRLCGQNSCTSSGILPVVDKISSFKNHASLLHVLIHPPPPSSLVRSPNRPASSSHQAAYTPTRTGATRNKQQATIQHCFVQQIRSSLVRCLPFQSVIRKELAPF